MKVLNDKKRVGVRSLVDSAGISGKLTAKNISFMLAPRINAPGRLEHAELSVKLLLENDSQRAQLLSTEINKINAKRQQIGSLIGEEAYAKLVDVEKSKMIFLTGKGWHPGVIGIVASKLSEKFNRPTILISEEDSFCRGSARSIKNFDVYGLLNSCKDLFVDFGGHKDAAGFEILAENIPKLEERLNKEIEGLLTVENLLPVKRIEVEIPANMINIDLAYELEKLEPYGSSNPIPIVVTRNLKVLKSKRVGSDGNHLKLKLFDGKSIFDSIGFGLGEMQDELDSSCYYDVAYNLSVNEWDGFEFPQMEIVDMRRSEI